MKLKRQTSTTATPTYPATLEYGDLAVANNGVPAFGDKDNLPVPLGTAAEIKQINSNLADIMSMIWLFDIPHTDNVAKDIDMSNYRALLVRVNYNNFVEHAIYPKGLLSTAQTKIITVLPTMDYYCLARFVTSYNSATNIASLRLTSTIRHSDSIPATVNVYGVK